MKHYDAIQSTIISPEIDFRKVDDRIYRFTARKFGKQCCAAVLGFDRIDPAKTRKSGSYIISEDEVVQTAVRAFHDFITSCERDYGFDTIYTTDGRCAEMIDHDIAINISRNENESPEVFELKYVLI